MTDLNLIEIFSSIQGEGVFIGRRQLFVRLAMCNLSCAYCDTQYDLGPFWRAEESPGSTVFVKKANPAKISTLSRLVNAWQEKLPLHHSLVLTGGEPLLQSQGLKNWLPMITGLLPVYLETNGTLPDELGEILAHLTWISMDVKLSSTTGEPTPWKAHALFLKRAADKLCQVKTVIDASTSDQEIADVARFVHQHMLSEIPLIIQPRSINGLPSVTGSKLLAIQAIAAKEHPVTLIIPQVHPLLRIG